jgi:predicted transcriptional regulator
MTLKNNNICLMSIKPKYFERIVSGKKLVEFRKVCPKNQVRIFLYVSSPVKMICGFIEIHKVITEKIDTIWELTDKISGTTEKEFYSYVGISEKVSALYIKSIKIVSPIDPKTLIDNFIAPQNYIFIENEKLSSMV